MRNIFAIFLILAAIGIYYGYTKNVFADIKGIKQQLIDYDDTLSKANQLSEEKQSLGDAMNSFDQADRDKLDKMIPDNADNVKLIIDIQNIAETSGLTIKNIKVNDENKQGTQATNSSTNSTVAAAESITNGNADQEYNYVTLSFSVVSTYGNYVQFLKKLEQSLRLVDITGVVIKPSDVSGIYNFDLTLRAYWIK